MRPLIPPRKDAQIEQQGNTQAEPLARDETIRAIRKPNGSVEGTAKRVAGKALDKGGIEPVGVGAEWEKFSPAPETIAGQ